MEIDFLGLNSPKFNIEQESYKDAFSDTGSGGGVETSLSLSTSSSVDCQRENLNFCEKKTTWEFCGDKMIPSSSGSSNGTLSSLAYYDQEINVPGPVFHASPINSLMFGLNDNSTNLRNIGEIPDESASLSRLYSGRPNVFKDTNHSRISSSSGDTPTVAMARRATLARFLEKRLHRMNQARTSHLMGKSLNAEARDTYYRNQQKKQDSYKIIMSKNRNKSMKTDMSNFD